MFVRSFKIPIRIVKIASANSHSLWTMLTGVSQFPPPKKRVRSLSIARGTPQNHHLAMASRQICLATQEPLAVVTKPAPNLRGEWWCFGYGKKTSQTSTLFAPRRGIEKFSIHRFLQPFYIFLPTNLQRFTESLGGSDTPVQRIRSFIDERNLLAALFGSGETYVNLSDQNKTKQNKTNKTKQNKTKQNKTKQNKTKQNKTKQNKTNKQTNKTNNG